MNKFNIVLCTFIILQSTIYVYSQVLFFYPDDFESGEESVPNIEAQNPRLTDRSFDPIPVIEKDAPGSASTSRTVPKSPISIAQQQFGGKVMQILCGNANCVFSPYSIYNVLGMILLGAGGNTEAELMEVMSVPKSTANEQGLHADIGSTKAGLLSGQLGEEIVIKLADNIFTSDTLEVSQSYIQSLQQYYQIEGPVEVNFGQSDQAADTINTYVSDATNGEIPELISSDMLNIDTLAVLINAVYLKADWMIPFDSYMTEKQLFYVDDSKTQPVRVDMMGIEYDFKHSMGEDMNVIELPYAGEQFFMYVVVPQQKTLEVVKGEILASSDIISILSSQVQQDDYIEVRMPKFTFKDNTNLKELLQQLGVGDLFVDGVADLSKMVPAGERVPYISEAVHEAKIEVAEMGTIASAATGAVAQTESMPIIRPLFLVDKPFMYFLVHKPTNIVLFQGQVVDPTQQE